MPFSTRNSVALLVLAWVTAGLAILPADAKIVSASAFKFEDSARSLHELGVFADCTEPLNSVDLESRFSAPKSGILVENVPALLCLVLFVVLGVVAMFMDSFEVAENAQNDGGNTARSQPRAEQLSWATLAILILLFAAMWQASGLSEPATTTMCQRSPPDAMKHVKLHVFDSRSLEELDNVNDPSEKALAGDPIVVIVVLLVLSVLGLIPMYADAEEIASEETELPPYKSSTTGIFQWLLLMLCLMPVAMLAVLPFVDPITLAMWQSASLHAFGDADLDEVMIILFLLLFVLIGVVAMLDDFQTFAAEGDECGVEVVCKSTAKKSGQQLSWTQCLMQNWRLMSCVVMLLSMCGAAVSTLWENAM